MRKSVFWDSYLSTYQITDDFEERLCLCEAAFATHKDNISRLINIIDPSSIAVLGSGYLNDIPLANLIQKDRKVFLVDWIDNVSKRGVSKKIISTAKDGTKNCLFCKKCKGELYCKNYTGEPLVEGVCTGYEPISRPFDTCKNYSPASQPYFMKADITGGVARHFSELVEPSVLRSKTVKQAFSKAISITKILKYTAMEIETNSIDFVTSSMVLSQFNDEPYGFFSKLIQSKFGRVEILRHEEKLRPLMEQLRSNLFLFQVESHIKEIHRIAKKNGRPSVYLSSEIFRSIPDKKAYFLVQDMSKALELVSKYFDFSFDDDFDIDSLNKVKIGDGISINQCYILIPKNHDEL